jgi:chemotaxis protein methyltransferase CheR
VDGHVKDRILDEVSRIELRLLTEAIHARYGYDFRNYAQASFERRVQRAMSVLGADSISCLQHRVLHEPDMLPRLLRLLTVQVSDLFRDADYYRVLRERIVPVLRTYPSLKIWVAGCSTGEEVFSLAILLREEGLESISTIYATDIDPEALRVAQTGVYALTRIASFTENHRNSGARVSLSNYYTAGYGAAIFDRSLLRRVVFANHSLATDHVFGEMQVVSCRNVLIYFNRTLQERALGLFAESLCRRGFLGLGARESLSAQQASNFREFEAPTRWFQRC